MQDYLADPTPYEIDAPVTAQPSGRQQRRNSDYIPTSGVLMFDVGETTKSFTVDLINDEDDEGDEIFKVLLSSPGGAAVVGGPSVATVNIVDDESASRLGHWSIPLDLPLVPIHMILLPTGKIMFYEDRGETNEIRLWDPETGIVSTPALPAHDIFCSGHSFLEDGTLLVTGGHILDNYGLDKASVLRPIHRPLDQRGRHDRRSLVPHKHHPSERGCAGFVGRRYARHEKFAASGLATGDQHVAEPHRR